MNGRWFAGTIQKLDKKLKVTERGSIVAIKDEMEKIFLVTTVFKVNGNKWHISEREDNPTWPLLLLKVEKYRFQHIEVSIEAQAGGGQVVRLKDYGTIEDGVYVQETYKLVKKLTCEKLNLFKI